MLTRRRFLAATALGAAGAGLAACAGSDPAPTFPSFSFNEPPILLNVAEVTVENLYSPLGEGHIEADFDVPPDRALTDWAGDRIQAAGASGRATVVINEASAVQQSLATTGGIQGAFQVDQAWKIIVRLSADIAAQSGDGLNSGRASVQVERTKTLPENVSFIERRQAYYTLTGDAIREFDRQAVVAIAQYLGAFRR